MISRVRSYAGLLRDPEVKPLLVILGIALVVQVIYFVRIQALYPPYGLTTEHYYSPLAQNLLHHGTYGFGEPPEIERSTTRPPFYSVVLAGIYGAFGENEAFALVFNNIVLFSTIIVVYMIGRTFSPKIGLLASLLFVLDPVSVINANKNQAEAVFILLMALFILVTLRAYTRDVSVRVIVLSSLILGLATMTRAPVNLDSSEEIKVRDLVYAIKQLVGCQREGVWDASTPNGQPRRKLDTRRSQRRVRLRSFGATVAGVEEDRRVVRTHPCLNAMSWRLPFDGGPW